MKEKISGRLVNHEKEWYGTIVFDSKTGLIEEVTENIEGYATFSPEDCIIFPGFGDIHIHAREDLSGLHTYKEDFFSAGIEALNGGLCHIADMPNNPVAPINDDIYRKKEFLSRKSPIHVTLYAGIGPQTKPLSRSVPYKVFMGPSVGDLFFKDNESLEMVIREYEGQNVSFHCEDPIILEKHATNPKHEERRPPEAEITATAFALHLIEKYKLRGKLCHYSTGEGLQQIISAKKKGLQLSCEVTPTHLFFDKSMLTDENRHWLQMNPPLRTKEDKEILLQAFINGDIDYLASDHAPHSIEEKQKGISGVSHLDTYSLFVTYLILEKKVLLTRIAETCAKNPGEFVNHYLPSNFGKGFGKLEKGYVANFTVLNLKEKTSFERNMVKSKSGWSPFEGFTFPGSIEAVYYLGKRMKR
ncbi:MAG: amidohydrolase [Leptospiraceae bacterium]|nr:amidohydrolase [Leptospiraceae bacterium]